MKQCADEVHVPGDDDRCQCRAFRLGPALGKSGAHGRAVDHGLTAMWLRPIRGPYERAAGTVDKPIGDLTMPEAMDWAVVLGYAGLTGYVIGKMAGNLLEVMLGGRRH